MILRDNIPFTKEELVDIAQSLGVVRASENHEEAMLVDMIINAVDEGATSYLPVLDDFNMHYFKEDFEIALEDFSVPGCYTRPEDADDLCTKCVLYQNCCEEMFEHIPNCFSLLYNHQDCSECILRTECELEMPRSNVDSQYEVSFLEQVPMLTNLLRALSRFRYVYQSWPISMLISKKNRYYMVRKRGITQRNNEQIPDDVFVFSSDIKELDNPVEPQPLTVRGKRSPIISNEYFAKTN